MEILKEFKSTIIYSRLVTVLSVLSQKISGLVDLDRSIRDASEKTNFWYILYTSLMPYIIYNKLKEEKGIAQIFDAPINLEDTSNILAYSPEIVTNYSYINPILEYIGLCCIYVLLVPYLYQKREILFAPFYVVFSPIKWLSQKLRLISAIDIAIKEGYFVFYWTVCWLIVRFSGVFSGLFNLLRDWSSLYFTNSLFINISLTLSSLLFALIFALLLTCILSCIKPLQNKLTKIHKGLYYSSNQSIFVNFVILTTYCFDWLNYSEERLSYEYGVTWFLFFNYVVVNSYISLVFLILWLNLKLYFSYVLKQIFPELVGYKLFLDKKGLSKWVKLHCTIFGGLKRRAFYLYFKKQDNVNEKIARRIKALALTVEALKQEEEENSNNFWKLDWDNSEFNIDVGTSQIFYKKNLSWLVPYHYDYLFKVFIWNNQMILEEQDICDEKFSSMDRKPLSKMKDLTANTSRREFHSTSLINMDPVSKEIVPQIPKGFKGEINVFDFPETHIINIANKELESLKISDTYRWKIIWSKSDPSKDPGAIHVFKRELVYHERIIYDYKVIKWIDGHQVVEVTDAEKAYVLKQRELRSEFVAKKGAPLYKVHNFERSCEKFLASLSKVKGSATGRVVMGAGAAAAGLGTWVLTHSDAINDLAKDFYKPDSNSNEPESKSSVKAKDLKQSFSGIGPSNKPPELKLEFKKLQKEVSTGSVGTPLGDTHSNH